MIMEFTVRKTALIFMVLSNLAFAENETEQNVKHEEGESIIGKYLEMMFFQYYSYYSLLLC